MRKIDKIINERIYFILFYKVLIIYDMMYIYHIYWRRIVSFYIQKSYEIIGLMFEVLSCGIVSFIYIYSFLLFAFEHELYHNIILFSSK